jgi:hypothetical protein
VTGDLNNIGASLPQGQCTGTVVVNGTTFNYSAYKLPNGTINEYLNTALFAKKLRIFKIG